MKKTSTQKILGGLMIAILVGTIGAVLVSAEDSTDDIETPENLFGMPPHMMHRIPFADALSEEQQTELQTLVEALRDEGATMEEIHNTIQEKLDEWGIEIERPEISDEERDEHLAEQIDNAEQHLEMLNRVKELREQGYDYEDIQDILQEEYDIEPPIRMGCGHGFHRGNWYSSEENSPEEDGSEL